MQLAAVPLPVGEAILLAARNSAQSHGYDGLNFRDLAADVGIKAARIYHHFPSKADVGFAVAKRYWDDTVTDLEAMLEDVSDPKAACIGIRMASVGPWNATIAFA
ncbi:TetR/AcrR family transcriptional regulator [Sphingomonas sp. UYP23]